MLINITIALIMRMIGNVEFAGQVELDDITDESGKSHN